MNARKLMQCLCGSAALTSFAANQTMTAQSATSSNVYSHYKIVDLGPVGPLGQPYHISNGGIIVGGAADNGPEQAVLWLEQRRFDLASRGLGGPNSIAFWVNDAGHVVGQAQTSTPDPRGEDFCGFAALGNPSAGTTCLPFLWSPEQGMRPLPMGNSHNGAANSINMRGEIAGILENGTPDSTCPPLDPTHGQSQQLQFRPVVWRGKDIHQLPNPAGDNDPDGVAFAINDKGQAVGATGNCTAFNATGDQTYLLGQHVVVWEQGRATDIGNLGGIAEGGGNTALGINNAEQVVGISGTSDGSFHGFSWTRRNGMQDTGTIPGDVASLAISVNDAGVIVGISLDSSFNPRAFVLTNGTPVDLNTLTQKSTALYLLDACSINDRGEIIGFAADTGDTIHGYLAKPDK
jgi:probable HAF family extracellular repeat protein